VIETDVHVGMALQDAGWTLLGDRTVKRLRDGCCLVCPCRDQLDTGGPHDRRQAPRQRFAGHHTMRGEEPRIGPSGGFGQGGPMGGGYKCRSRFVEPDVPVLPNPKHLQVDTFAGQDCVIRRGGLLRTPDCAATLAGMAAGTHVVLELAGGDESALSRQLPWRPLGVDGLDYYRHSEIDTVRDGLVIGYASPTPSAWPAALVALIELLP
jgi:hypothetical protein